MGDRARTLLLSGLALGLGLVAGWALRQRQGPPASGTADASLQPAPAPDASPEGDTWTLTGRLLPPEGQPVAAGYRIFSTFGSEATSDASGRFAMQVPRAVCAPGENRILYVVSPGGARAAWMRGSLVPDLRIDVDAVVQLRGRVVDNAGRVLPARGVDLLEPGKRPDSSALAWASIDPAQGRFELEVPASVLRWESMDVLVGLDDVQIRRRCSVADLRSPEGATLVLDVCPVTFELTFAEELAPLDAKLRLVAWRPEGPEPQELASVKLLGRRSCRLLVEAGLESVELVVAAQGYAPWVEERSEVPCDASWRVDMSRLGTDDVVEGRVLDADGEPAEHAMVLCRPPSRFDARFGSFPGQLASTDELGRFSLPVARGQPALLGVENHALGSIPERRVQGGDRDLVLQFEPTQEVSLTLIGPDGELRPGVDRQVELLMVLEGGVVADHRMLLENPVSRRVPLGRHRVISMAGRRRDWSGMLWGELEFEALPDAPCELVVRMEPPSRAEGNVLRADGAPAAGVRVANLDPRFVVEGRPLYAVQTDDEGAFRLLLGRADACEVELQLADQAPSRASVRAGPDNTLTLP